MVVLGESGMGLVTTSPTICTDHSNQWTGGSDINGWTKKTQWRTRGYFQVPSSQSKGSRRPFNDVYHSEPYFNGLIVQSVVSSPRLPRTPGVHIRGRMCSITQISHRGSCDYAVRSECVDTFPRRAEAGRGWTEKQWLRALKAAADLEERARNLPYAKKKLALDDRWPR